MSGKMSGTPSEMAPSELLASEGLSMVADADAPEEQVASFPPYPPYAVEPAPPSVADAIIAGHGLRLKHKSKPTKSLRPLPKPAKPRGPKATDVKMTPRAIRAYARCLRRHGAVLTDRLEYMSKPRRRNIIYLWREHAYNLPPDTIARLRSMLDADEPFKPDQAYEYFVNLKKTKKKAAVCKAGVRGTKKDVLDLCKEKKFVWARNATVAFARGIQQRLARPGNYALADGMLRLSDIILHEICGYMHMRTPSRRCQKPKAKFMMEMSDKVAVWIDEILSESDDRMLMMDFDEDDDILLGPRSRGVYSDGMSGDDDYSDRKMGDDTSAQNARRGERPAYLKFEGNMKKAFEILTNAMEQKGDENLISFGKFEQTYKEGSYELKRATDLKATEYSANEGEKIFTKLSNLTKDITPPDVAVAMIDMLEICTNYLAQNAEYNKEKGPAFKLLVQEMKKTPNVRMYEMGKIQRTNAQAAKELEKAKGLEVDHDEPNLSQTIHSTMQRIVSRATPKELKTDMDETVDSCSKYLSQKAIDDIERGPAFDLLIKELERYGHKPFSDYPALSTRNVAAYVLHSAPGLGSVQPDPKTVEEFKTALHRAVDSATPKQMAPDMTNVINLCSNYLSAFIRDRGAAMNSLVGMMRSKPKNVFAERLGYTLDYATGADEIVNAPALVPYLPIKDIADEGKANLARDMKDVTPPGLEVAMKAMIKDTSKHLSQLIAIRSGVAGDRYKMNFLTAVTKSLGSRPLYKYKSYGKTYADAAEELKTADSTEPKGLSKPVVTLSHQINSELKRGMPTKLAPTVVEDIRPTMDIASKHLAKIGVEKGDAMDYMVNLMKDKGEEKLGKLQGYEQTYSDGARRLENTMTLQSDNVDVAAYSSVKNKLTAMTKEKPDERFNEVLPDLIDDSANFLSAPIPQTKAEQKQVLADLLGRQGDKIIGQKESYKMTYQEGGEDVKSAPVGVTTAHDEQKNKEMVKQIEAVIPDKKLEQILKESTNEGAAFLTDAIEGRGQALQIIEDNLKKEGQKEFINVGAFKKDHAQVADMITTAPNLKSDNPSPVILENVEYHLDVLPKDSSKANKMAQDHMKSMTDITAQFIATKATKDCGLDAEQLAALDAAGFNDDAKALAEQRRLAAIAGGPGQKIGDVKTAGAIGSGSPARPASPEKPSSPERPGDADDETAEQRQRRLAEAEKYRKHEEEQERLRKLAEEASRRTGKYRGGALGADYDPEHLAALEILHQELKARGTEVFYQQPKTTLTHNTASEWLADPDPIKVDKSVKDSADTARLHKKFERKLSGIVKDKTPAHLNDSMQDVVIEAARKTAEMFVTTNYNILVKDGLVSEMQKRGNEILTEVDGAAETYFFAAQRHKRKDETPVQEPCYQVANDIGKKLEDVVRGRAMPRKLSSAMREHVKDTSKFLSAVVTKPDDYIEAYVALLAEMEAAGDSTLIEGDIPKTCKESANYLRQLTTFNDEIGRPNSAMQSQIQNKLKNLMAQAPQIRSSGQVMNTVIADSAGLLVSYVMLQAAKADVLGILVQVMKEAGEGALLRHGTLRKTFKEGADLLHGKATEELDLPNADPVVARKIQIKLANLMKNATPDTYRELMAEVIEEATTYLAVHLLEPRVIKVCKCYKNVFVQCELWCDEILRRVARPCCTCSRHVSVQALQDLAPQDFLHVTPDQTQLFAPGVEITLKSCPHQAKTSRDTECPAHRPTTSYVLYATTHKRFGSVSPSTSTSGSESYSPMSVTPPPLVLTKQSSPLKSLLLQMHADNAQFIRQQQEQLQSFENANQNRILEEMQPPPYSSSTSSYSNESSAQSKSTSAREVWQQFSIPMSVTSKISPSKSGYSSRTPIISAEHCMDWDATMVSLLWNVLAWRDWIQEIVEHALAYQHSPSCARGETGVSWLSFYRRVTTEALQWRQYSVFSRQLTTRLHSRYRDEEIESSKCSKVNKETYIECQEAMLDIVDMFHRWTQWLTLVVKETDSLQRIPGSAIPLYQMRWNHLKTKVEGYSKDWANYNKFLKVSWEQKYSAVIADFLPSWNKPGPVWVVGACGAVPSGAVAAGIYSSEVIWVARVMHRSAVLPATLLPSKHCCLVYAEGQVYYYSKYEVMCNAEVRWVAWRGGSIHERAVSVEAGMHVGRIHYHGDHLLGAVHEPNYHCHVVIFGRPFAFNCYELLMLAGDVDQ